jgi:RNA polymerase sigma-70 factor (ECF subfamily)
MRMPNDQKLLQRARRFEMEALSEIYDTFSPAIYRYAIRLLGDVELAEECVADTFSRFLMALKNGKGPCEYLQAYLYRMAHNWITDQFRSKVLPTLPLDFELRSDVDDDPSQLFTHEVDLQRVRAALKLLTPDQRQVIALKYLEDLDNTYIARVMNKPVSAVKALQHRGIKSLRRMLFFKKVSDL